MAKSVLNARIYLAECDLSGVANAAALNVKNDVVDCTAFSDAYKDKLAGLADVIADVSGFFSAAAVTGNPDHKMFDQLALNDAVLSILPEVGAFGTVAYFFRPTLSAYTPLDGKVGAMATFKLHAEGAAPLVKGQVLIPNAAKTTTGSGAAAQLGAVSATQNIYCAAHIFAVSGTLPTLDMVLESDDNSGFTSPTTRITFTQKVAIGQDYQLLAGPITDTYWRINYTIGGTLPSFTLAVVAGIV